MPPHHVSTLWDCDWEVVGRSTNHGTIYLSRGGSSVMCGHTIADSARPCCSASGGRRVILLPQVTYSSSQVNLDRAARITGEHGSSACVDMLLHSRRAKEAAATYDIRTAAERCDSVCLEAGAVRSDFRSSAKRHLA
jgi:hypothetical protein